MRKRRLLRRFAPCIGIAVAAYLAYSCPEPMQEDFIEAIRQSAVIAAAAPRTITIQSDGNGVVSPSGGLSAKDGIPIAIGATAFSSHVFSRWIQADGDGRASFQDEASAETAVTVTGGDATVRAVFSARPIVYYATPSGTGIYTNTKLYVHFSKDMDEASIEAPGAVQLLDGGSVPVAATVELTSPRVARITPAANLQPQRVYIVKVVPSIKDLDGATMQAEYTSYIRTTSGPDIVAPSKPTFLVDGLATTPTYKSTRALSLTDIVSNDEGEVIETLVKVNDADYVSFPFANSISLELPGIEGPTTILMKTVDSVGNVSVPSDAASFTLDLAPPVIDSLSLTTKGDGSGLYVNSPGVTVNASVSDSAGSPIRMRYSVDAGATWQQDWIDLADTQALTLGAGDGQYSILCQFSDAADPVGHVSERTLGIILDTVPPVAVVSAPATGSSVAGIVSLEASLSDERSGPWKIEYLVDGESIASRFEAPYAADLDVRSRAEASSLTLTPRCYDRAGNHWDASDAVLTIDNYDVVASSVVSGFDTFLTASCTMNAEGAIYVAYGTQTLSACYASSDYGINWAELAAFRRSGMVRPFIFSDRLPASPLHSLSYNSSTSVVSYRSSGYSWQPVSVNQGGYAYMPACMPQLATLGQGQLLHAVYLSSDSSYIQYFTSMDGMTWEYRSDGSIGGSSLFLYDTAIDANYLYILYRSGNLLKVGVKDARTGYNVSQDVTIATVTTDGRASLALWPKGSGTDKAIGVCYVHPSSGQLMLVSTDRWGSSWEGTQPLADGFPDGRPEMALGLNAADGLARCFVSVVGVETDKVSVAYEVERLPGFAVYRDLTQVFDVSADLTSVYDGTSLHVFYADDVSLSNGKGIKYVRFTPNY